MFLRLYKPDDLFQITELFYNTINAVNIKDYTPQQVRAWSGRRQRLLEQSDFFSRLYTLVAVAEKADTANPDAPGTDAANPDAPGSDTANLNSANDTGEIIIGYGNIDDSGYLDHLFVHKDYQGKKIATALCDALEAHARSQDCHEITVHASITARPFFERRGYTVEKEQIVTVDGVPMKNYAMKLT